MVQATVLNMLAARLLLLVVLTAFVGTAILEDVGRTDLEADRTRLEKSKRSFSYDDFDLLTQVKVLRKQVEELKRKWDQKNKNDGGTTYVRWGRTVCPGNGTDLMYRGYMAGTHYSHSGNGPNNLCLPEDPTWAKYQDGAANEYIAHVYGTEYEMGWGGAFTPFSSALVERDVPCAACQTTRSSSIMIPGRTDCYSGWTLEYSGYLVSMYYGHAGSTEYVCLDGNPQSLEGGETNLNGHVIYLVDVVCGPLPCPPYVNGRELACVVCSK